MNFDTMLNEIYNDEALVEWVENASHESLQLHYMELMARYRLKSRELKKLERIVTNVEWERNSSVNEINNLEGWAGTR